MDLNTARELVQSKQIIYAKHEKEIERKIRILNKRADKHKDTKQADKFRNKALE
jgi:ribonucleotide reductase alpha subunit